MKYQNKKRKRKLIFGIIFVFIILLLGVIIINFNQATSMVNPAVALTDQQQFKILLEKRGFDVSSIDWKEKQILVNLSDNLIVLFLNNDKLESQVTSLQFIISRSKIEGKRPVKVDLRFDKPIITF